MKEVQSEKGQDCSPNPGRQVCLMGRSQAADCDQIARAMDVKQEKISKAEKHLILEKGKPKTSSHKK